MNILHILDERWDSGITNYGLNLAAGLRAKRHNVLAACLEGSPAMEQAKNAGIEAVKIGPAEKYTGLKKLVKSRNIKIIHTHTGSGNYIGCISKTPESRLIRSRGDIRPAKRNIFTEFITRRTDHVICAAKFIADDFKKQFPFYPANRISVVYQGIDIRREPAKKSDPNAEQINIGIVGRLDPVKGHSVLVDAARIMLNRFPNTKFYIAGREANLRWDEICQKTGRLSISGSFIYCGYVNDVYGFMDKMDIGVIASVGSEAISRAALEWMASGKALVASRTGCIGEIVENHVSGLLYEPGDYTKLAEHLVMLGCERMKIAKIGRSAAERVKKHFSFDSFIAGAEKIYNAV